MRGLGFAGAIAFALAAMMPAGAQDTITLNVGDNFQNAVDSAPGNTVFIVKAGTHTGQAVVLKDDNQFVGQDGAVMDGEGRIEYAFQGSVANVVIRNLELTNYNPPEQQAVINCNPINDGRSHSSHDWLIEGCEVHHNGGGAISVGDRFVVRDNYVHHQEQIGIVYGGQGSLVEGNEVAFCNWEQAYDPGWEAGGSKWKYVSDFTLRYNYSHDNFGPGFWADFCRENSLIEGNVCVNNSEAGIIHEISWSAKISCNICINNGRNWDPWLWGAGILVSTSADVEIAYNVVAVNSNYGNGIAVVNQHRGSSWYSRNANVHHNEIIHRGNRGRSGVATDTDFDNFWANSNNRFDYNTYHVPDETRNRWQGGTGEVDWKDFQAAGYEEHGAVDDKTGIAVTVCEECRDVLGKNPYLDKVDGQEELVSRSSPPRRVVRHGITVHAGPHGSVCVKTAAVCDRLQLFSSAGRCVIDVDGGGARIVSLPRGTVAPGAYVARARSNGQTIQSGFVIR